MGVVGKNVHTITKTTPKVFYTALFLPYSKHTEVWVMSKRRIKKSKVKDKVEFKSLEENQVERLHEWNSTFFSNQTNFNFDGRCITLDFQRIAPRTDPKKHVEIIEHNAVMLDIFHARDLADKFKALVDTLETQFGSIDSPQFLKKVQEQAKAQIAKKGKVSSGNVISTKEKPSYLG